MKLILILCSCFILTSNSGCSAQATKHEKAVTTEVIKDYYPSGALEIEGEAKNGVLHGLAKMYYENGNLKESGNFVNGKPEGIYRTYYESGALLSELHYKNGLRNRSGKIYYENGDLLAEGNIVDDFFNFKSYYEDGSPMEEYQMKNDKFHGLFKAYSKDRRTKKELNYLDGKLNGLSKIYVDGRLIMKSNYKDNILHGELIQYYSNGIIKERHQYNNGELISAVIYDQLGKAISEWKFIDGQLKLVNQNLPPQPQIQSQSLTTLKALDTIIKTPLDLTKYALASIYSSPEYINASPQEKVKYHRAIGSLIRATVVGQHPYSNQQVVNYGAGSLGALYGIQNQLHEIKEINEKIYRDTVTGVLKK